MTAVGGRPAVRGPSAFLGPDYDDQLKAVYTTTSTADVVNKRGMFIAPFSDAVADTRPLRALIERYINNETIKAIAAAHRKGRRLFTANLDAGRGMIWNLGATAASDYPRKVALTHDGLQASSVIPSRSRFRPS